MRRFDPRFTDIQIIVHMLNHYIHVIVIKMIGSVHHTVVNRNPLLGIQALNNLFQPLAQATILSLFP